MCEHSHHITHHKPKEENTKKEFMGRVLGPDGPDTRKLTTSHITHHCISPAIRHHISPHHTLQAERREHKEEVYGSSSWAGWAGYAQAHHITHHTSLHLTSHQTSHLTTSHITSRKKSTEKKFLGRALGPDRRNLTTSHITHHCISPDIRHHISPHHTSQAERREHKEEVLGPSSWAGKTKSHHITHHTSLHLTRHQTSHLTTSHITSRKKRTERRSSWAEFLGRIDEFSPHHTSHIIASHQTSDITSHHITHYKPKEENRKKKFLGRVLGPDRRILTTSHITHHCISPDIRHHISPHHASLSRKKRTQRRSSWAEFLGRMAHHTTSHIIHSHLITCTSHHTTTHITHSYLTTSNTTKKKFYEFFHENPLQEHPRRTKSTRITTKNEHRRS